MEGTRSVRAEMGTYTAILRQTPDHEDLVTVTDSEVLYRVVGRCRWVGQGGKTSLVNKTDVDILEYFLAKLSTRILGKSRTFLEDTQRGVTERGSGRPSRGRS